MKAGTGRRMLILVGALTLIHGLFSAYQARPIEQAPQSMSELRGIQIGFAFRYLWMALGLAEATLGLLAASNLLPQVVYVGLIVIGVVSCGTLALGTGGVQIALGIWARLCDSGPATGIEL